MSQKNLKKVAGIKMVISREKYCRWVTIKEGVSKMEKMVVGVNHTPPFSYYLLKYPLI